MGFTLIELLIVIAILGILAAAVIVAINPGKRAAQARDAKRKQDINAIANALIGNYAIVGYYPWANTCVTSRGSFYMALAPNCHINVTGSDWDSGGPADYFHSAIVVNQGFLKKLPLDPKNDTTYYYRYQPLGRFTTNCDFLDPPPGSNYCVDYWIGVRLEAVDNPAKKGKMVFRCSDSNQVLLLGQLQPGCKEVEFSDATGFFSFDSGGAALK
ncbi:MAG: hypothetical protein UU34_C0009G0007 [Candidatus Curtissbacteria bacterium GW2011_GWA1_41_11]|uniref:Uncharacterized protein n=1 Tax=Candidatus Curtissbacteria bacterium GW2011_GWA1_41_11 TaxID=1618409 RepID=A0A0G0UD21_9BACT|nr:MAG: hypothetical protein UU34_C0009G0007 [Candidatus Curtissbacteria bacterium GW2011_GWA1_41_11]